MLSPLATAMEFDRTAERTRIEARIRDIVRSFRRRGCVVAISGGIDSSVCAALSVGAIGRDKVFGLLLPERDSSDASTERGRLLAEHLGIQYAVHDIAPTLEAIGCYEQRDAAIRDVFPEFTKGWRQKIAISGGIDGQFNHFKLIVRSPGGETMERRLPHAQYLQIVAATNYKQRIRKTIEYFHADRLNYAVVGTPNRLEYDQGFFVKNGDGSADLKPIAHLFKSQVYAMARHMDLPSAICSATPTTDTYSLPQGQDEFYFALPFEQMDLALWAFEHNVSAGELEAALQIEPTRAAFVYADIQAKRKATEYLGAGAVRI